MLTPHLESFTERLSELKMLLPMHYEELALNKDKVPLDPMFEVYLEREKAGQLIFATLRSEGKLVGYFVGFIMPHLHYRTCLTCTMDVFYLSPESRGQRGGLMLFKFVRQELKRRGVKRWVVGSKCHKDASVLFEALGMNKIEIYYSEYLGD